MMCSKVPVDNIMITRSFIVSYWMQKHVGVPKKLTFSLYSTSIIPQKFQSCVNAGKVIVMNNDATKTSPTLLTLFMA